MICVRCGHRANLGEYRSMPTMNGEVFYFYCAECVREEHQRNQPEITSEFDFFESHHQRWAN